MDVDNRDELPGKKLALAPLDNSAPTNVQQGPGCAGPVALPTVNSSETRDDPPARKLTLGNFISLKENIKPGQCAQSQRRRANDAPTSVNLSKKTLNSFEKANPSFARAVDDQNGNAVHDRIGVTASGASKRYSGRRRRCNCLEVRSACRAYDQTQEIRRQRG